MILVSIFSDIVGLYLFGVTVILSLFSVLWTDGHIPRHSWYWTAGDILVKDLLLSNINYALDHDDLYGLDWTECAVNPLGVVLSGNETDHYILYYKKRLKTMKNLLSSWKWRYLSRKWKVPVINSLAISPLLYLVSVIQIQFPCRVIQEVKHIVTDFIWNGKPPMIAYVRNRPRALGPIGRMGGRSLYSLSFFMVHLVNLWRVDIYQGVCRRVAGMCWWPQFMVTSSPITKWLAYCRVQPDKKYLCSAFQTNTRDRRFNQSNIYSQWNNNNWFGSERAVIHKHNHKTRPSRFNTMLGSLVSIIKQLDKNEVYSHSGNTLLEVSRI